jgi:plasmid stabilization system protein ParE
VAELAWSDRADRDLKEISEYIARTSAANAAAIAVAFHAAAEFAREMPLHGQVVPEFRRENFRERQVENFRMLYTVSEDVVTIAAIYRGSRQLPRRIPK